MEEGDVASEDDSGPVDLEMLVDLDAALARVPDAVPWADRSENSVEFRDVREPNAPAGDTPRPPGVAELYELCGSIDMADVDNGWFVHPAHRAERDDEFIPRAILGRGSCFPLGSDGVGGWLVVDDDGAVLLLAEGVISGNRYEPPDPDSVREIAGSIRGLVEFLIERTTAAGAT